MPRRRNKFKTRAPVTRIQEDRSLMHAVETPVYTPRFFFLDFVSFSLFGDLGGPLLYNPEDYDFYPNGYTHDDLQPHPRIRELDEQAAEKHAQELLEEERKCKEKAEKNQRKKLRKKEKRLEKQNAVKALSREEEGNSENQDEDDVGESDGERNGPVESAQTPSPGDTADEEEEEERSEAGLEEEKSVKTAEEEEEEEEEERSEAGLEEEKSVKTAEEEEEEDVKVQVSERRKSSVSNVTVITPGKAETTPALRKDAFKPRLKQNPGGPAAEECEKRSRELARIGCRLAGSGQLETAVQYFTDAIKYDPKEFKLFGNRSLCYERMQQFESALRDAEVALSLEPRWMKGLFRKGKALCGLKRYYEASLIYREVLALDSSSVEAKQELKNAQTLHLMEMGFSWAESSKALGTHGTMEEAIESLFNDGGDAGSENPEPAAVQEEERDGENGEWITPRSSRHRAPWTGEPPNASRFIPSSSRRPGNALKPKLFSVWVGVLAPSVTYVMLQQLFSRAGTVYSIKMLLEQECAYVNYTNEEDCDRAIQSFHGTVVEGARLTVRHPRPTFFTDPCRTKECFFWRTTGCTRSDCNYKHDPDHRGIDRDKFTSRLGNFHTSG